jgi:alkylation response protein AidB-like acyl-CoA dehydrogenase
MTPCEVLDAAEAFFREHVQPRAQEIDENPSALGEALDEMGRRNLLALKRPLEFGGPNLDETCYRTFQELSARHSGALSFLMTQHQSAVSLIAKSPNRGLKERLLPQMADGTRRVGIGISQLRRPGPPIMTATRADSGFELTGIVPWVTGWGFFDSYIVGAALGEDSAVYGLVPLCEDHGGSAKFSPPMRLAALESPQTVVATYTEAFLPDEEVLFEKPAEWARRNDMINIVLQGHFALGCAMAGVDQVRAASAKRPHPSLPRAADALEAEINTCRACAASQPALLGSAEDEPLTQAKLEIRAWAIDLAARCAHAGVIAWGGAANAMSHPAQRVYREALVFSVSAQTPEIMEASLDRLVKRG